MSTLLALFALCGALPADGEQTPTDSPKDPHEIAPGLTWGASVRLRGEVRRDTAFGASTPVDDEDYLLSRIRMSLRWAPFEGFVAFLEGQDAEIGGEGSIDEDAVPNIFADDLDFHQAYAEIAQAFGEVPLRLRAGRQKLAFGQERLVGPLEWVNTARVFDAARLTAGKEGETTLDLFASRVVPVDPNSLNDWGPSGNRHFDSDFHGLYVSNATCVPGTRLEAYGLLRHEDAFDDEVYTVGVRTDTACGPWTFDSELAVQFGEFGGLDHRAAAAHVGLGHEASGLNDTRFGLQYNFATGDSDPTDGDHGTFDNLYPTNHAHYGYMDFFSWQNVHNVELNATTAVCDDLSLRVAVHEFWLAKPEDDAWYNAGLGVVRPGAPGADRHVGTELDLVLRYPLFAGRLPLELGYSHFFTGEFVEDTGDDDDADFVYLMTTFVF